MKGVVGWVILGIGVLGSVGSGDVVGVGWSIGVYGQWSDFCPVAGLGGELHRVLMGHGGVLPKRMRSDYTSLRVFVVWEVCSMNVTACRQHWDGRIQRTP